MEGYGRYGRLLPGVAGALLVVVGLGGLNPVWAGLADGSVVALFELELAERLVAGWELPLGQGLLLLAVLAGLAQVVVGPPRRRRRLGLPALALSIVVACGSVYLHVGGAGLLTEAAGGALLRGEVVHALPGFWPLYLGAALLLGGALAALAARPRWRGDERFLRVAVLWNGTIVRERVFPEARDVTIGEGAECDFVLPTASAAGLPDRLTLFRRGRGERFEMALVPGLRGALQLRALARRSERVPAAALLAEDGGRPGAHVVLDTEDWGVLQLGALSLFFQFVSPEERVPRRSLAALPWDLVGTTTVSAVVQVAVLLGALFLWQERAVRARNRDIIKPLQVSVRLAEPPQPEEESPALALAEEPEDAAARAPGAEGTFGDPEVDPEIESRVPRQEGRRATADERIDPRKVGLNDLLASHRLGGNGPMSRILSHDAPGFGDKLAIAMNGTGADLVLGHGSRGLSFRGTDTGGGGNGAYGVIHGLGPVDADGLGPGRRLRAGRKEKKERPVGSVDPGTGTTSGFCRAGDITKAVRLRASSVRACYEQRLQLRPTLAGKLTVRWTIRLDGTAGDATVAASTLGDRALEQCVLRAVRRMRFTAPEGGLCVVSWPFVFSPG